MVSVAEVVVVAVAEVVVVSVAEVVVVAVAEVFVVSVGEVVVVKVVLESSTLTSKAAVTDDHPSSVTMVILKLQLPLS